MNNYFRPGFSSFCETFYKMKGNPVTASETAILHPGEFDNPVNSISSGRACFAMDNNIDAIFATDNKHDTNCQFWKSYD